MAQGTAYDGMDVLEGPQQGQAVGRVYLGQPDRPAETGLLDVGDDELHQEQPADPPPTFAERRRAALLDRFEDVPAFRTSLVDAAGRHIKAGRDRAEGELVGLGQNVEAVHTDAWDFYDSARGALDDDYAPPEESAIERSFAAVPTIEEVYRYANPHAGNNLFETAHSAVARCASWSSWDIRTALPPTCFSLSASATAVASGRPPTAAGAWDSQNAAAAAAFCSSAC